MGEGSRLGGKVACITGGSSGIGRAAANRFAAEGAQVVVCGTTESALAETVAELGGEALAIAMDVTDSEAATAAFERMRREVGRIDVLVNNAGVGGGSGPAHALSDEAWDREVGINLTSVFKVSRAAWPLLVESHGAIINTSSIAGLWAIPGTAAYCVAKAGVIMLTKCLALDGAKDNIRSNCVCPGHTNTPLLNGYFDSQEDPTRTRRQVAAMFPLGRLGEVADIAGAMVYLASDEAAWVTGSTIVVDGGLTSGMWFG